MNRISDTFPPLSPNYVGADLSNKFQLYNILEWALHQTGKATVTVLTFSISEEFIRKVLRLKNDGLMHECNLILDFKAVQKTQKIVRFSQNVFSSIAYCKTHAKMVLIQSNSPTIPLVLITGSQNATRGNRTESIIITTKTKICTEMLLKIENMKTMQYGIQP